MLEWRDAQTRAPRPSHAREGLSHVGFTRIRVPLTRLGLCPRHPLPEGRGDRRPRRRALLPSGEKVAEQSEAG